MKFIKYTLLVFVLGLLTVACDEEDERLDFLSDAENRPASFYAWSTGDTLTVTEGDSGVVRLQTPWTLTSGPANIVVSIDGSAAQDVGNDIKITNVTTVGDGPEGNAGSITVNNGTIQAIINQVDTLTAVPLDLEIKIDTDGVPDGDKFLVLEITSASNSNGELGIGDNNGDKLIKVIKVADVDCESDLSATYDAGNSCNANTSQSIWVETAVNGTYELSDMVGGTFAAYTENIPAVIKDACGLLSGAEFDYDIGIAVLHFYDISGTVNEDGSISLTWSETAADITCTTTFTPQ